MEPSHLQETVHNVGRPPLASTDEMLNSAFHGKTWAGARINEKKTRIGQKCQSQFPPPPGWKNGRLSKIGGPPRAPRLTAEGGRYSKTLCRAALFGDHWNCSPAGAVWKRWRPAVQDPGPPPGRAMTACPALLPRKQVWRLARRPPIRAVPVVGLLTVAAVGRRAVHPGPQASVFPQKRTNDREHLA
jgi:hypothetical protein